MSTVVVGGGLAGLYTAYRLTLAGHKVTVREAAPHWGGMISPVEVDGILVDAGAEAYAVRGGLAHALCTELGLEVAGPVGTPHIWWSDGSHPMADGVLGIPGSLDDPALEVLTDTERARLAEDLTMDPAVGSDALTVGALAKARLGEAAVSKLIGPVAEGVYATTPDHLPLVAVAPGLHDAIAAEGSLIKAVASMRANRTPTVEQPVGGLFQLVEALVDRLQDLGADVRAAAAITHLRRSGQGFQVHTHDGEDLQAERLVLATPASVSVRLLSPLGVELAAPPVNKTRQVIIASTNPALAEHPVGSGVLVASRADVRAKALTHYSAKWPWAASEGVEVLRLSYPEDVFPTRQEVIADASLLTGVALADSEVTGLASVSWDAMPTRIETANRDYLISEAAHIGIDLVGAWLDGNGVVNVLAGCERVQA